MSNGFSARIEGGLTEASTYCVLSGIPAAAIGQDATFSLTLHVDVTRSSGIDSSRALHTQPLKIQATTMRVAIEALPRCMYRYVGQKINMSVRARLVVDDGLVFDTRLEADLAIAERKPQASVEHAAAWIEPTDSYSLAANLRALSAKDRMIVQVLLAVAAIFGGGNAALGLHDEFVPESQTYWYDHSGDDGSESPAMKSLTGSGALGLGLWVAVRARLRRYMRIALRSNVATPRAGERIAMRDLVEGEARVALERTTLRVVAANRENGQYSEKSGKETKTHSFSDPLQAVILFEQFLAHVPAGSALADHVDGDVDFDPIFSVLLPPQMAGSNHGIDVVWEVQLLHPEFVDQELTGPVEWTLGDWSSGESSGSA